MPLYIYIYIYHGGCTTWANSYMYLVMVTMTTTMMIMMMTPMMVENTSSVQVRNGSHFHWHPSQQFEWQVDASLHLHLCFAPLRPSHSHRWTWWFTKAQQPWIWLPHCLVLMSGKWTLSSSIPIDRWLLSLYIPHLEHLYIQRAMILSIYLLIMHLYIYTITGIHAYINKNRSVVLIYSTLRTHVSYKQRYLLNITYIYIIYICQTFGSLKGEHSLNTDLFFKS